MVFLRGVKGQGVLRLSLTVAATGTGSEEAVAEEQGQLNLLRLDMDELLEDSLLYHDQV
ncbi:Alpha-galactosidase [Psidium guajava]|nr:Alpha-galactosidase [Psidium guajava]